MDCTSRMLRMVLLSVFPPKLPGVSTPAFDPASRLRSRPRRTCARSARISLKAIRLRSDRRPWSHGDDIAPAGNLRQPYCARHRSWSIRWPLGARDPGRWHAVLPAGIDRECGQHSRATRPSFGSGSTLVVRFSSTPAEPRSIAIRRLKKFRSTLERSFKINPD